MVCVYKEGVIFCIEHILLLAHLYQGFLMERNCARLSLLVLGFRHGRVVLWCGYPLSTL